MKSGKQFKHEDIKELIKNKTVHTFIGFSHTNNGKMKIAVIKCKKHGRYTKRLLRIRNGDYECPECLKDRVSVVRFRLNNFKLERDLGYKLINKYSRTGNRFNVICLKHRTKFVSSLHNMYRNTNTCPDCRNDSDINYEIKDYYKILKKISKQTSIEYLNLKKDIDRDYKLKFVCPKHGIVSKRVQSVLLNSSCPECSKGNYSLEDIRIGAELLHGTTDFDFTKLEKVGKGRCKFLCRKHGTIEVKISTLVKNNICRKCWEEENYYSLEKFTRVLKDKFGDRVKLKENRFINLTRKLVFVCSKHKDFIRKPYRVLDNGCPYCNQTSKGELEVMAWLDSRKIYYVREFMFKGFRYRFDFYLPKQNLLIEYDGIQHYEQVPFFNGRSSLENTKKRDKAKNKLAKVNDYGLLRISYLDFNNIDKILEKQVEY